jgi:hypothetical protein
VEEIRGIILKYNDIKIDAAESLEELNPIAAIFFEDVAEIYDVFLRIWNDERNPGGGFSVDDAPILGLLVRIRKLITQTVHYYKEQNAEIISLLERPILEAATMALYLMRGDSARIEDYRKCSYKDRLRILRDLETGSEFFNTKPGQRLLKSVREKLQNEGLTPQDFQVQKKNGWRVEGRRFFDIFEEVQRKGIYASTYGMMSESVHGSWNESQDWCLLRSDEGTYRPVLRSYPADIRFLAPTIGFTNPPFRLWIERIGVAERYLLKTLQWIDQTNTQLFIKFDKYFDE